MSDVRNEDEIDLVQVVVTLWKGKWLIFACMLAFLSLGATYVQIREPKYESQLFYELYLIAPGYPSERVLRDFEVSVHSPEIFRRWTNENSSTSLSYEMVSNTTRVDNVLLQKNVDEQLISLSSDVISIASGDLRVLDDLHRYLVFVNEIVTETYKVRVESDYEVFKRDIVELMPSLDVPSGELLSMSRFLSEIDSSQNLFQIDRPAAPSQTSSSSSLIIALCALCGAFLGVFGVLIRSFIKSSENAK